MSCDIEHAVTSLRPYMQRRMAKLALAGARFVVEHYEWKVMDLNGDVMDRYANLELAINEVWRRWLSQRHPKDAEWEHYEEWLLRSCPTEV